ncbi:MAG: peptidoglycan-associated lipoprotein Pal [Candidatus Berkiellales bacterium]
MEIRGLRHIALSVVLCLGVVGCAHKNKGHGEGSEYGGASSQGAGDGTGFAGGEAEMRELLAKRKIYFDFDRYDVHEQDFLIIQAHSEYMKSHANTHVRVEGHADELGSREYNVALGEKRARAVKQALESQGVPRHQISTVSFGKEKPDVDGHGEEAHRLNRRAVIVYEER